VQLVIVLFDLIVGLYIGFRLGKGKSIKRNIIWGIVTILVIAPLLAVLVSFIIGFILDDGWTGIAIMVITFPLFFFIGIGRLFTGITRKNK